eukprot:GGOE01036890.1.p1 GENE.GGOE01036890.1~~GGOE01036890.1.p1  ORF type:complete len:455 (+),score=46.72 GGOE01036890.1:85-1365(+)
MAAQTTPRSLLVAYNPTNYSQKPKLATRWETENRYQFATPVMESPSGSASHPPHIESPAVRAHPSSIFASMPAPEPQRRPSHNNSPQPSPLRAPTATRARRGSASLAPNAPPLCSRREYGSSPRLDPMESAPGTAQATPVVRAPTPPSRGPFFCYRSNSMNKKAGGQQPTSSRQSSPNASRTTSPRAGSTRSSPTRARPPSPSLHRSPTSSSVASAAPAPPLSAWAYIPMPPALPAAAPLSAPRGLRAAYQAQSLVRQDAACQTHRGACGSPPSSPTQHEAGTQMSPRTSSPCRGSLPCWDAAHPASLPTAVAPCPLHQCPGCQTLVLSFAPAMLGAIPVLWAGHHHPCGAAPPPQGTPPPLEEEGPAHAPLPTPLEQMSHTERRNPKRYRGLPHRCTELIQPAGKPSVPRGLSSSTVSDCFHIYD